MVAINIDTQQITYSIALPADVSVSATISSVDLTKSYVFQQGSTMGRPLCSSCSGDSTLPKGSPDNNFIGLFAHELFDSVTVRSFRPPVTGGGQAVAD
jgi:hypothetical protein